MLSLDHPHLTALSIVQIYVIVFLMLFCYLRVTDTTDRYQHPSVNPNKLGDPSG